MNALSFVLGDGRRRNDLQVQLSVLRRVAKPGDEVIVPMVPPVAPLVAMLRQNAQVLGMALPAPGTDRQVPSPATRIALRYVAPGGLPPVAGLVDIALRMASAAGVVWLPESPVLGQSLKADVQALRQALANGNAMAIAPGGLVAVRRGLLRRAVLPLPETPPGLERAAFFWRCILNADRISGALPSFPPETVFGPPPDPEPPEALAEMISMLDRLVRDAGGGAEACFSARDWLLQRMIVHLQTLPPSHFWAYAESMQPLALSETSGSWRARASGVQADAAFGALALLAEHRVWRAVLAWQAARRAGRLPGADRREVVGRAQEQWRLLRAGRE